MFHRLLEWILPLHDEPPERHDEAAARRTLQKERERTEEMLEETKTQIRLNKAIQGLQESAKREPHAR